MVNRMLSLYYDYLLFWFPIWFRGLDFGSNCTGSGSLLPFLLKNFISDKNLIGNKILREERRNRITIRNMMKEICLYLSKQRN